VAGDPKRALGKKIRELREANGASQEKLAELADLHRTYIGSVEGGERNVALENIVRLARALGTTPSKLLEEVR
jgi:transcriptional regulator with XRE-family HTH domain